MHNQPLKSRYGVCGIRDKMTTPSSTVSLLERCDECALFSCIHKREVKSSSTTIIPTPIVNVADKTDDDYNEQNILDMLEKLDKADKVRVADDIDLSDKETDKNSTMPVAAGNQPLTRVLIPPPPKTPSSLGAAILSSNSDIKDEHIVCNICKSKVLVSFLDSHQKVHTIMYDSSAFRSTDYSSSDIIRGSRGSVEPKTYGPVGTASSSATIKIEKKVERIPSQDTFKFRKIEEAFVSSSTSVCGRYSDITVQFLLKEKPTTYSSGYSGAGSSYSSRDYERFVIHIAYDAFEDYYSLVQKTSKRSQFSSYENEDCLPERICYQEELFSEIKGALLFVSISPRTAYKFFRKAFSDEFIHEYDESKRAYASQNVSLLNFNEKLKKSSSIGYGHHHFGSEH